MNIILGKTAPTSPQYAEVVFIKGAQEEKIKEDGITKLIFCTPEKEELNLRKLRLLFRKIISTAKKNKIKRLSLNFGDFYFKNINVLPDVILEQMATNFLMANYEFNEYKETPKEGWNFVEEVIVVVNKDKKLEKALERGILIGEYVNQCRDWANIPGSDMTPRVLANKAAEAAYGDTISVSVLGREEMERHDMNAVLAVAKGSIEEPRFIVLEYWGGGKTQKPIVLIGKGVTFDSGGHSLKPSASMIEMNMDMSGGAAVINTIILAAKLKIKKNIVVLVPAVENSISGSAYRPGDIIRSMSGKTIEVLNTDAEGRIILADALTYAKKYNPEMVIDVATLTGAAMVALGERASAIFSRDENLIQKLQKAGEESGDFVWPLPLWEEFEADVKGKFGDVTNIHNKQSRYGGAIEGAIFLLQFAKDFKSWAHIDMAPRMESTSDEFLSPGAAGSPVRLLINLLSK